MSLPRWILLARVEVKNRRIHRWTRVSYVPFQPRLIKRSLLNVISFLSRRARKEREEEKKHVAIIEWRLEKTGPCLTWPALPPAKRWFFGEFWKITGTKMAAGGQWGGRVGIEATRSFEFSSALFNERAGDVSLDKHRLRKKRWIAFFPSYENRIVTFKGLRLTSGSFRGILPFHEFL